MDPENQRANDNDRCVLTAQPGQVAGAAQGTLAPAAHRPKRPARRVLPESPCPGSPDRKVGAGQRPSEHHLHAPKLGSDPAIWPDYRSRSKTGLSAREPSALNLADRRSRPLPSGGWQTAAACATGISRMPSPLAVVERWIRDECSTQNVRRGVKHASRRRLGRSPRRQGRWRPRRRGSRRALGPHGAELLAGETQRGVLVEVAALADASDERAQVDRADRAIDDLALSDLGVRSRASRVEATSASRSRVTRRRAMHVA